jgi:hypothetical protein
VYRIGFWAALFATVLNIAFVVTLIAFPGTAWQSMYQYSTAFKAVDLLPSLPSLLLAPVTVALFTAVHYYASQVQKIASHLGLVFAVIYAVLSSSNYFVQLTVVRMHLQTGETAGLAPFVMANPGSVVMAIDTLGYAFLFLACLFTARVFSANRLTGAVRWLLTWTGFVGLAGVLGYVVGSQMVYFVGLMISGFLFLPATALLAVLFLPAGHAPQDA